MSQETSPPARRPPTAVAQSSSGLAARIAAFATAERVLVVLVAIAVVWRSLAALDAPVPWIVPDEPAYALLARGLWEHGELSILGGPTPYLSVLYPVLAGLPLELGGLGAGYDVLRVLQALVLCSTAVVVFAWARSLVRPWWALAGAALTLLLPGLAVAGTLTPEALLIPLATLAAWLAVRALEEPSRRNQALLVAAVLACALTQPEGHVVAIAAVAGAVVRGRVRELVPTWVALGVVAALWVVLGGGSPFRSLGDDPDTAGYTPLRIVELVAEHAGLLVLVSGIVPLCAVVLLALTRPAEPAVRSSVAVILALAVATVLEVGLFAARHADRLVERRLLLALPPLLAGFAVWLGLGAPRPRWRTIGVAAAAFAGLIALPIGALATADALADNPSLIPLIQGDSPRAYGLVALAAGTACALLVWLPRRAVWLLPVAVGTTFLAVSVSASRELADQSRLAERTLVGPTPDWIDRATDRPVGYLYDGGVAWSLAWIEPLWNEGIAEVLDLTPRRVPGPLPQGELRVLGDDGELLLVDGRAPGVRAFVAPAGIGLDGRELARKPAAGAIPGLTLWEVDSEPRVRTWAQGLLGNGDIGPSGTATLEVFDCGAGTFRVIAVGRDDAKLTLARDGTTVATYDLWPRGVWEQAVTTPPGSGRCTFSLSSSSLVHLDDFSWTPAA